MTTTIYLIRHGETEWNRSGRWQGQADVPLSEAGRAQAYALARRLVDEGIRFDHVYASDLSRAFETAEIVAEALKLQAQPLAELREINVGGWSGLTRAEIIERYPGAFVTFFVSPDGEAHEVFGERVSSALIRLAERHPGETLAIVTHGGTIRSMLRHIYMVLGDPDRPIEFIGNTSLTIVQVEEQRWSILRLNDTAHLECQPAPDMLAPSNEASSTA